MREWRVMSRWRAIPSCPGYEASDYGRIYSLRSKRLLSGSADRYGYYYVNVMVGGERAKRKIHRLVCEAFHGPCPDGFECAHLDGDCTNNTASNLAWVTRSENTKHQMQHGTFAAENLDRSRIPATVIAAIKQDAHSGLGGRRLAAKYGINRSTAHRIVYGRPKADARTQSAIK